MRGCPCMKTLYPPMMTYLTCFGLQRTAVLPSSVHRRNNHRHDTSLRSSDGRRLARRTPKSDIPRALFHRRIGISAQWFPTHSPSGFYQRNYCFSSAFRMKWSGRMSENIAVAIRIAPMAKIRNRSWSGGGVSGPMNMRNDPQRVQQLATIVATRRQRRGSPRTADSDLSKDENNVVMGSLRCARNCYKPFLTRKRIRSLTRLE